MNEAEEFSEAIEYYELKDLGFSGYKYAWSNNRPREENIHEAA